MISIDRHKNNVPERHALEYPHSIILEYPPGRSGRVATLDFSFRPLAYSQQLQKIHYKMNILLSLSLYRLPSL